MKRILLPIVMLLTAFTGVKAADDLVSLTFNRTSTTVASVTVNSSAADVTAQLVSLTGPTTSFKGTSGSYLTSAVLCPDMNANASSAARVLTFKVDGLSGISQIGLTILGLNGGGNYQNEGGPERSWNISCAASSSVDGTPTVLATFNKNVTVGSGESKFELMATDLAAIYRANEDEPIYLTLTITPTTTNGCFFGLSEIKLVPASAEPEVVHTFSADKVYYIQWKNTGANYITENRDGTLTVADKKNSKYQFWRLIPVEGKSHCYTIQNVVTENFLGTCNMNPSSASRVSTSATAVEYYIGATAGSGNIAGCYYFSSTDCDNYSNETAGPRALNKDGASSYIITWTAGLQDGSTTNYKEGSYWKIVETDEEYQAPEPPVHGSSAKNLTVYFRPCGVVSNTYLTAATIGGVDPIAYTATAKPGSFHVPFSKDRGAVRRGSEFEVSITLSSTDDADLKANAYFDWNADGEFETTAPISLDGTAGTATVTVPEDAVSGDTRMRIRLNSNGLDRADDDVEGFVYDFPLTVVDATTERKVYVDVNGDRNGTATLSAAGDSHAVGTQLTATATPKGNATFDSWREGGVVVSTDAEYTFTVEDRNMTLKAYFTPNTEPEATPAQWDITFNRTSATEATATVTSGGKAVEGVTAAIAMSTEYKANGTLASDRTDLLCSTTNSSNATAGAPIKYTLTITNTTEKTFAFDYIEASNVALNNEGKYQGADVKRVRNFKVTYGSTTIGPEERYICDNSHCNGKEYPQGFGAKVLVPAGGTYTIVLDIYGINHDTGNNQIGSGCFYGLSKIALGNTAVSFGTTGYTTLYAPIALTIPEGVTAYTGTLDENNTWLTLKSIEGGVIPKEHAVILESEAGNEFTLEAATGTGTTVSDNALKGQTSTVATSMVNTGDNEAYTLQRDAEDGVAFKRYTGASLAGGKAYLMLPRSLATQQKALRIRFAGDGSTAIDNSEFTIQNSSFIYDLQGRRVLNPTKGVYIVNGNKVVIK